jgi:hypothetical protein
MARAAPHTCARYGAARLLYLHLRDLGRALDPSAAVPPRHPFSGLPHAPCRGLQVGHRHHAPAHGQGHAARRALVHPARAAHHVLLDRATLPSPDVRPAPTVALDVASPARSGGGVPAAIACPLALLGSAPDLPLAHAWSLARASLPTGTASPCGIVPAMPLPCADGVLPRRCARPPSRLWSAASSSRRVRRARSSTRAALRVVSQRGADTKKREARKYLPAGGSRASAQGRRAAGASASTRPPRRQWTHRQAAAVISDAHGWRSYTIARLSTGAEPTAEGCRGAACRRAAVPPSPQPSLSASP